MKDLKNMKKDKMMAKERFNNNFNTFMLFMVNPFFYREESGAA